MFHVFFDSKGFIFVHQPISSLYIHIQYRNMLSYLMVFEPLKAIANTEQTGAFWTQPKFRVKYAKVSLYILYTQRQLDAQNHKKQLAAQRTTNTQEINS